MRNIAKTIAGVCLLVVLAASPALPYALTPWGSATGGGVIGIQPTFFYFNNSAPIDDVIAAQLFLSYGITDKLDVIVDVLPLTISPEMEYGNNFGMIRYELIPDLLVVLGFWVPAKFGDPDFDFQIHYSKELSPQFLIQANLMFSSILDKQPGNAGVGRMLGASVAANYYFNPNKTFGVYLELNPVLPFADGSVFSLGIVPGLYAAFGPEGKYSVSLGMLNDLTDGEFSIFTGLGLWAYTSF